MFKRIALFCALIAVLAFVACPAYAGDFNDRSQFTQGYGGNLRTWTSENNEANYTQTEYRYNQTYNEHCVYSVVGLDVEPALKAVGGWIVGLFK